MALVKEVLSSNLLQKSLYFFGRFYAEGPEADRPNGPVCTLVIHDCLQMNYFFYFRCRQEPRREPRRESRMVHDLV